MNYNDKQIQKELSVYKQLADQSGIIGGQIIKTGVDFTVAFASSSFYKLSKLNAQENILVRDAFAFLPNFDQSFIADFYKDNNVSKKSALFRIKEGQFRLDLIQSDNTITFSLKNVTPINDLQKQLESKNKQLVEVQKMASIGHWVENHNGEENYWSEQIFSILNTVPLDSTPSFKNYLQFVHPDDRTLVHESFKQGLRTKTGYELKHRLQLKNGAIKHVTQRCYSTYSKKGEPLQTIGIIQDISTAENTKKQLKQSEQMFRSVIQDAPIAVVLVNRNTQPILSNRQFCNITGYSMEEVLKHNLKVFTYSEDLEHNKDLYQQLFKGEIGKFTVTKRYQKKDKSLIWVRVTVSAVEKSNGTPDMAIAMVQDITAEKEATQELIKSEYKYRTLIENANDGIGLFTPDFKPIIYNTALYNDLGYTIEDYLKIDHLNFELFHPDDKKDAQKALEKVANREKVRIEKRLKTFEGEYKHFSISYIPIQHNNQPAILIFRRDISKRKEAEAQNEEYRLFLETIMDNLPVSLFAKTIPDFRYVYWNKAAEVITGIPAEEAIGNTDFEIYQFKKDAEQFHQEDKKLAKWKGKIEAEVEQTNSKGELKFLKSIKTLHQSSTGNPMVLGITMDITKLKEAEQKNEQSTQMLKEAQKIAKLGYWEYDIEKDLIFDNLENRQILGTENLPYFINLQKFTELLLPSDKQEVEQKLRKAVALNKEGELITRLNQNNRIKHINVNYKPITNDKNKVIKLMGTSLDITRIKESELALIESEKRLKQAEHIAKLGYWNYNYKENQTNFSDEVWNLLGLSPTKKPIQFTDYLVNVMPADKLAVLAQFNKAKNQGKPFSIDFRIISAKDQEKYIRATGTFIRKPDGELTRSIGTFQDITETKNKEVALMQLTKQLNEIQGLAKVGFYSHDLLNNTYNFSDTLYDILEIKNGSRNLKKTQDFNQYIYIEDRNTISKTLEKTLKTGGSHNIKYRIQLSSGQIKYINETCRVDQQSNPESKIMTRIFQDVSNFEAQNFEIKQNKAHLQEIKQKAFIGTWEYNIESGNYTLSSELTNILEIKNNNLRFKDVIGIVHPDDRHSVKKILLNSFKNKESYTLNYRMVLPKDKSVHYIQDSGRVLKNPQGDWINYGIIRDITDIHTIKQQLVETYEVFKTITENSIFAIFIYSKGKISYLNDQWAELTGIPQSEVGDKKHLRDLFKTESETYFNEIFTNWEGYKLEAYSNKTMLHPINGEPFLAELFVKKIWIKQEAAFMVLAHKTEE